MTASASLKQVQNCSNRRLQPRVAMRLHDGDHLALGRFARGAQHGRDFDRMMAVVVDEVTPFHSPVRVKRRLTPPKLASALRIASSLMPSSCATAIAAVALSALWRPGIGSVKLCDLVRRSRRRGRGTAR